MAKFISIFRLFFVFLLLLSLGNESFAQHFNWVKYPSCKLPDSPTIAAMEGWKLGLAEPNKLCFAGVSLHLDSIRFGSHVVTDTTSLFKMFVGKIDSSGSFVWVRVSDSSDVAPLDVCADSKGNVFLLADFDSLKCNIGGVSVTGEAAKICHILCKFDPSGNVAWIKKVAAWSTLSGPFTLPQGGAITLDKYGNIYVGASYSLPNIVVGGDTLPGYGGTALIKFDTAGNVLWVKAYSSTAGGYITKIVCDNNDNVYYLEYRGSGVLVKHNSHGTLIFYNSIGDPVATGMAIDNLGGIYTSGWFSSDSVRIGSYVVHRNGVYNSAFAKFDTGGHIQWLKSAIGSGNRTYEVSTDTCGNVFFSGEISNFPWLDSISFDGHSYRYDTTAYGNEYICQYTNAGTFISCFQLAGSGDDISNVLCDNQGHIYLSGDFVTHPNDSLIWGNTILTAPHALEYFFVAKYAYDSAACMPYTHHINSIEHVADIRTNLIYPNPATASVHIHCPECAPQASNVSLIDMYGRAIIPCTPLSVEYNLKTSDIPDGVYLLKIVNLEQTETHKIYISH